MADIFHNMADVRLAHIRTGSGYDRFVRAPDRIAAQVGNLRGYTTSTGVRSGLSGTLPSDIETRGQ